MLVYVGATWCEPCQRFHDAVANGDLDEELQRVRFLEFDLDEDKARLREAGYTSRLIPLFAVPTADGRMSDRFTEGSNKGPTGVENILRRLIPLVAAARGTP